MTSLAERNKPASSAYRVNYVDRSAIRYRLSPDSIHWLWDRSDEWLREAGVAMEYSIFFSFAFVVGDSMGCNFTRHQSFYNCNWVDLLAATDTICCELMRQFEFTSSKSTKTDGVLLLEDKSPANLPWMSVERRFVSLFLSFSQSSIDYTSCSSRYLIYASRIQRI